ncbi:hypothetical protein JZ751_028700 [Albula glossodonta]|uniref:C2H2-type domain-containing protein n=1 Tax=Albula glossodonta TaxID=121402 RepID=A0A8T2NAZ3_9TELE|nr:hypothetical protein JZ751_028700 [Albula glossodonta]
MASHQGSGHELSAVPTPLGFSIDRIMSKSSEPKSSLCDCHESKTAEGKKKVCWCPHFQGKVPVQCVCYDGNFTALVNSSEMWKANLMREIHTSAMCIVSRGGQIKTDSSAHSLFQGTKFINPQVVRQACTGSLHYFNYLSTAYVPCGMFKEYHFSPSKKYYSAQAYVATSNKLSVLENPKSYSSSTKNLYTSESPQKQHLPGQLDQIVMENRHLTNGVTANNKFSNVSIDGKPKKFKCDVCGKVFNAHYNLRRHMPVHTGARPFVCKLCGKGFRQASTLCRHKVIHTQTGSLNFVA